MTALAYLVTTAWKNRVRELRRNPGKLVLVILFLALLVFVLLTPRMDPVPGEYRDRSELYALALALYGTMFLLTANQGFAAGGSFFTMSDVNLLFVSPLPPKTIMGYGLLRQLGTSLMVGAFLLFQYSWLNQLYGITPLELVWILLGYALCLFAGQLCAMTLYSRISGDDARRKAVKRVYGLVILALAAGLVLPSLLSDAPSLASLVASANAPWVRFIPVFGWIQAALMGTMEGAPLQVLAALAAMAAFVAAIIPLMLRSGDDFYEDVLQSAEVMTTAITAKKEGKMTEAVPRNVKMGRLGLGKGWGPSAFYHKHRVENRRARVFLLDAVSLIFIAGTLFFVLIMKGTADTASEALIAGFAFATYMQMFSTATGRWVKELLLPYVYLVPSPPFAKLLAICRENLEKVCLEAVLLFVIMGLLLGATPLQIAGCILARISFSLLFMAGNILTERLVGSLSSKVLVMFLYMLILLVVAAPGIVLAIVAGSLAGEALGFVAAMGVLTVWNLLAGLLIAFLCRNILNFAELNNK